MDRVKGSDRTTQFDLEGLPRHVALTDGVPTYQMKVSDCVLSVVSGTGEDATGIVTLPALAEAVGKIYYIVAPTGVTGDDVSLYEKETGSEYTDGDMDADGDYLILFCTGAGWLTLKTNVA